MTVHHQCRHFRGDRPCAPHKNEGVHCGDCPHHDPVATRILIVKLDAVGDVLRTTCILKGLREGHPGPWIDWVTREEAAPIFDGNPLVDRVVAFPGTALVDLLTSEYDLVISLDPSPLSAKLGTIARGRRRLGFGYDPKGFVYPLNPEAAEWLEMGLFDDVKLRNRKSYQDIVLDICGLGKTDKSIRLYLTESEKRRARSLAAEWGIGDGKPVIGLNTGAGSRWERKKWTEEGFLDLIRLLRTAPPEGFPSPRILLLGGPEERERNRRIAARSVDGVVDTGSGHGLREFFSIVDLCDLIVTGDTMALHVAAALGKSVVALFGPTSAAEIELYGKGTKIVSNAPCVGCYRTRCNVSPTCMERISQEEVLRAVRRLLTMDV